MESLDYNNAALSPSWLLQDDSEQDFCFGAKASESQFHSAYQTPPSTSIGDEATSSLEWNTITEDFGNLDCFNDVVFPEDVMDFANLPIPEPLVEEPNPSAAPFTIKLKTVKFSKKKKKLISNPSFVNTFTEVEEDQTSSAENLLETINSLPSHMTLGEVIDNEDVSKILDDLLMEVQDSSQMMNSDCIQQSFVSDFSSPPPPVQIPDDNFSYEPMEFFTNPEDCIVSSPVSSSFSTSSSPCWSPPPTSPEQDDCWSPKEKTTKRVRKPRQKLSPDMKKLRKKEQNKEAALRYRNKKREEETQLALEIRNAEVSNEELKSSLAETKKDIGFMKKLLLEAIKAKNKRRMN